MRSSYYLFLSGCNTVAVACYAAVVSTFGTVVSAAATPAANYRVQRRAGPVAAACTRPLRWLRRERG